MQQKEPIIRLIIDTSAKTVGEAVNLTHTQCENISNYVADAVNKHDRISIAMQDITEHYTHEAELAYALFELGCYFKMSQCPLHRPGGIAGLLGGIMGPDEDIAF